MCLSAIALQHCRRFPLVLALNRDEFFDRPTAALDWWRPDGPGQGPEVLGGRDLLHGGTWLGLTAAGRLALVTNVRRGGVTPDPQALSRGGLVPEWLAHRESPDRFWMRMALGGHSGFHLVAFDFKTGHHFWASNLAAHPQRLGHGLFGLSNGLMGDADWPKVAALKARLGQALKLSHDETPVDDLAATLFEALADPSEAPDGQLPETGVSAARERALSAAFIRSPDGVYGTRSSTLVIAERVQRRLVTHVLERTFTPQGEVAMTRRTRLRHWPPRRTDPAAVQEAVVEESRLS